MHLPEPHRHLRERRRERGEPDADAVRCPEVRDHPAPPARRDHVPGIGVGQRHVPAPARRVPRRGEGDPERRERLVGELHGERGERRRLRADRLDPDLGVEVEGHPQRHGREHRRRPGQVLPHPGRRHVARGHRELVLAPEPALHRLAEHAVVARRDVGERGRARPGAEVLVGAPDGEVGAPRVEGHRHRPDRVAEVPAHERARVVHHPRDRRRVGEERRAVGDVGEHDERGARPDRVGHLLRPRPRPPGRWGSSAACARSRRRSPRAGSGRWGSRRRRARSRRGRARRRRRRRGRACRAARSSSRRPASGRARPRAAARRAGRRARWAGPPRLPPSLRSPRHARPSCGSAGRPSRGR